MKTDLTLSAWGASHDRPRVTAPALEAETHKSMWRANPVVELGNGVPDTYGGQHKTEVQMTVKMSITADVLVERTQHYSCAFRNSRSNPKGLVSCSVCPRYWQHRLLEHF